MIFLISIILAVFETLDTIDYSPPVRARLQSNAMFQQASQGFAS